jgi:hypothetical protein
LSRPSFALPFSRPEQVLCFDDLRDDCGNHRLPRKIFSLDSG